ncbi:MAG: NAD(P)/FAD-dependent oxidoreductase [archaeon]
MQGGDCTIIGGGPVGLFLAHELRGMDVKVIEEHKEIGKPVQCTGLISRNINSVYKMPYNCVLKMVRGAVLCSPSGKHIELSRREDEAYVIDRSNFDKSLSYGVEIEKGKQARGTDFKTKYVVGADGTNSTVAQSAGFPQFEEVITGLQYEIPGKYYETDFVELYFGNDVAPGFFAWIVPAGDRIRVGLGSTKNPKEYLDRFLDKKFPSCEILERQAGQIPLKPRKKFVKGNIALVGDAAGHAKPTTGGGVYFGMRSARILADAIKHDDLSLYEKDWNSQVGRDFWLSGKIRNAVRRMPDKEMEKFWDAMDEDDVRKLLLEHGDMDHPTKIFKAGIRNPKMLKFLPYVKYLF